MKNKRVTRTFLGNFVGAKIGKQIMISSRSRHGFPAAFSAFFSSKILRYEFVLLESRINFPIERYKYLYTPLKYENLIQIYFCVTFLLTHTAQKH